ncbi:gamma-glutamylcyclotransferase [Marivibrio halodurans]|uniref:glutathione-specific gamma-glutamylcyclotransferase n=1 Tax=Marivibrio halodurans TaxID=2039722 RepID=A0A8J7S6N9_9PROT|nr:gamma-glutamylcyclotransferase [Marivibrio halodurans]MBP5856582.1 gamma-glutamylcyclotransferase [Marivibrio halodurans]
MAVDREGIKSGYFQRMAEESMRENGIVPLSDAERRLSRDAILASRPVGAGLWVFGYGSLMWNPAFHYVEKCRAKLFGYHRSFCLQTPIGRGSKDFPGLVLGLDRGGSVRGVAFRIAEEAAEEELDIIWAREMLAGSYCPRWVHLLDEETGARFRAISFVMRRECDRYAGDLDRDEAARRIAHAAGRLGPCREYLENTVLALHELGIADGPMHDLLRRVRVIAGGGEGAGEGPRLTEAS